MIRVTVFKRFTRIEGHGHPIACGTVSAYVRTHFPLVAKEAESSDDPSLNKPVTIPFSLQSARFFRDLAHVFSEDVEFVPMSAISRKMDRDWSFDGW